MDKKQQLAIQVVGFPDQRHVRRLSLRTWARRGSPAPPRRTVPAPRASSAAAPAGPRRSGGRGRPRGLSRGREIRPTKGGPVFIAGPLKAGKFDHISVFFRGSTHVFFLSLSLSLPWHPVTVEQRPTKSQRP